MVHGFLLWVLKKVEYVHCFMQVKSGSLIVCQHVKISFTERNLWGSEILYFCADFAGTRVHVHTRSAGPVIDSHRKVLALGGQAINFKSSGKVKKGGKTPANLASGEEKS